MKNLILFPGFLFISVSLCAQPGKLPVKSTIKIMRPPSILKTLNDSASYAIGMSIGSFCRQYGVGNPNTEMISRSFIDIKDNKALLLSEATCNEIVNKLLIPQKTLDPPVENDTASYAVGLYHAAFFKQQGMTDLDTAFILKAVNDVLGKKTLQFNDQVANRVMNKRIILIQEEKARPAIEAGRAFLADNKKRPEVKITNTGLQYEIMQQGKGIKPLKADTFVCHYRGTLIDGTEFDASYNRGEPLRMGVSQVIRGWTEGLQLMPVGSKYKFYIPYELAYGPFENNAIPGGSVLIFELELLDVIKPKAIKKTPNPVKQHH